MQFRLTLPNPRPTKKMLNPVNKLLIVGIESKNKPTDSSIFPIANKLRWLKYRPPKNPPYISNINVNAMNMLVIPVAKPRLFLSSLVIYNVKDEYITA